MKKYFLLFGFFFLTLSSINAQWEQQAENILPPNYIVINLSIINDSVVWAAAIDITLWGSSIPATHLPIVLRTTNGGVDWTLVNSIPASGRLTFGIVGLNESTALLSTFGNNSTNEIFKTTNSGDTWDMVYDGPAAGGRVMFFNETEGVCINAFDEAISRTDSGGDSWTPLTPGVEYPPFSSNDFLHNLPTHWDIIGDTAWIGTAAGKLYKSTDKGLSWTIEYETDDDAFYSITFLDSKNGLATVGDFFNPPLKLLRTADGGESWGEINNEFNLSEVFAIPCTNSFIGVSFFDSYTVWSSNLGDSWGILSEDTTLIGPTFSSAETGWAAGIEGGAAPAVYKWTGDPLNGRTYVNHAATGNNDGSSWADAYNDLQLALFNAQVGDEIWVAEGTYLPGDEPSDHFLIDKNLKLYGGFAGTECNLSERDIELYPTVLSGDVEGDDLVGNFEVGREDNMMTIIRMTSTVTNETVVDGFTIQNGHADGSSQANESGGGIYSNGTPIIQHCKFEQNFATNYGALALRNANNASGNTIVQHCQFMNNRARAGGAISFNTSSGLVDNCEFKGNSATQWGGAIAPTAGNLFLGQSLELRNCRFEDNEAGNGGGAVHISLFGNNINSNYRVYDCDFVDNESDRGGGLDIFSSDTGISPTFDVAGCTFSENISTGFRSALSVNLFGPEVEFSLKNCEFVQNDDIEGESTAGINGFEESSGIVAIDSCIFDGNTAIIGGLALGNAENSTVKYILTNSFFDGNQGLQAGAIGLYAAEGGTQTEFTIAKCTITNNVATINGGGISIWSDDEDMTVSISQTEIIGNESPIGGAIHASPALDVFPDSVNIQIDNSLIADNTSTQDAAIVVDSVRNFSLINCTVANNQVSSGIRAGYQSHLILQNTILNNNGMIEFETVTNDVTLTSNGGNLISDGSLVDYAITYDLQNTDPLLDADYYPMAPTSPAIDKGVDLDNLSEFDLNGNPRKVGCVDIGAYESEVMVSMECVTDAQEVMIGEINLSPNPATDFLQLQLPESITQPTEISLFDPQGRLVGRQAFALGQAVQVGHLPSGFYTVKLAEGERVYVGKFIKK